MLNGCLPSENKGTPSDHPIILGPLDWNTVDQIAKSAFNERFPQVDKNHVTASDFRLYTYELDHNGNPKEYFIQSFEYQDPENRTLMRSPQSIACRISTTGEVYINSSRTFPFEPSGTDNFMPIKLDQPLKTPNFNLIDSLAKSAIGEKVDSEDLVFRSLTINYRSKPSTETFVIMFYDSSSVRIEMVADKKTMFYTWVRVSLDSYGEVKKMMWHSPEMNIEGRKAAYLVNQPYALPSVPWPPER